MHLCPCLAGDQLGARGHFFFFFFNDTATTEIYTLSLHDALPICSYVTDATEPKERFERYLVGFLPVLGDRKSTRLNSSHLVISYAVFCLKKKKPDHRLAEYGLHRQPPLL